MAAHRSYRGVNVDHLYADCPACPQPAKLQTGWVDTEGTDICRLCLNRWRTHDCKEDNIKEDIVHYHCSTITDCGCWIPEDDNDG